jgi:1-acyl-sn-glycerol-3-phosphate acyltransferase
VIGIFPEGPFSQEGRLVRGQPGAALVALRAGVPVVPAAIEGTYEALRGRRFYLPRRRPLAVRFGEPIHLGRPRRGPLSRIERDEVIHRIMSEIAALLRATPAPAAAAGRAGAS